MDSGRALGLWKSSFGPVKIERDVEGGPDHLMGIWVYDRAGQEVVGYFSGPLSGNVMQFRWNEPARPRDLVGEGYLVFDPNGQSFTGRWWTVSRDRTGDWNGWRNDGAGPADVPPGPDGPDDTDQGMPPEGETPPGEPPPGRDREEGPAEQAPGPPPEDV
jgi:hypothetical protein